MLYGVIAAIAWGTSAVAATNAARRAGTYIAVLSAQGLGVVVLLLLTAVVRPSFAAVHGAAALGLAGAGLAGLLGYLTFYRAIEDGPVGLASAISATYGGVTTLLAVLVLGEHLGGLGAAGVVLAVAGIALAAARSQAAAGSPLVVVGEPLVGVAPVPSRGRSFSRAGIALALASALTYGIGGFLLGKFSAHAGWLGSALVAHGTSVTALLIALPFLGRPSAWRGTAPGVLRAGAAGLTDAVGLLAFSRGGQVGQVAVTAECPASTPSSRWLPGWCCSASISAAGRCSGLAASWPGWFMLGRA